MAGWNDDVERACLARVRAGDDRQAWALLVAAHQQRVRSVLRRWCDGDAAAADDLAQETFVAAWRALPNWRGDCRFSTWLHAIATNVARQRHRSPAERVFRHAQPPAEVDAGDVQASALDVAAPHDDDAPLRRLDIDRALRALSEGERQAIIACCFGDLSHAEAAQALGWPLGTVKTHMLRGKAKLARLLADWRDASP